MSGKGTRTRNARAGAAAAATKSSAPVSVPAAPARRWLTPSLATIVLAILGIADAGYLTYVHYNESALVCTFGSCLTVQSSRYAEISGFPIAILGLLMYIAIAGLWLIRWQRPSLATPTTMAIFCLALIGLIYSAYLTYLELFVIKAICQYCVGSAILILAILLIEGFAAYKIMMTVPED